MQVLSATAENVRIVAQVVGRGGLVVFPTDTVYGLGCDPFNVAAVERLIRVKGGRKGKPLPVLASGVGDVERIAVVDERTKKVANRFWPGALTLILPKRSIVLPDIVTFGSGSVGARVPNHEVALELVKLCGGVLVGTSANTTGKKPAISVEEAVGQLGDNVDMILDGGETKGRVSSTVVDLTSDEPKILRSGVISSQDILKLCKSRVSVTKD